MPTIRNSIRRTAPIAKRQDVQDRRLDTSSGILLLVSIESKYNLSEIRVEMVDSTLTS